MSNNSSVPGLMMVGEEAVAMASDSLGRGVAGMTRKNESILFMLLSLLFAGTESDRAIFRVRLGFF